ncbi:MAG: hypothetical protein R3Y39_08075 [Rikenellaceae bacterium]
MDRKIDAKRMLGVVSNVNPVAVDNIIEFTVQLENGQDELLRSGYWDRKGENKIDIIAVNDFDRKMEICEVKRNRQKISLPILERKASEIIKRYTQYEIEYRALSLEDM